MAKVLKRLPERYGVHVTDASSESNIYIDTSHQPSQHQIHPSSFNTKLGSPTVYIFSIGALARLQSDN